MGVRTMEAWRSPTPNDTRTYHVTAGVTNVSSVQITNNSGGEVWLMQGSAAPRSADDADFIVPPRATANYPLDHSEVSAKWNGQVTSPTDLITFTFDNQSVAPAVYPGVEPITIPPPLELEMNHGVYTKPGVNDLGYGPSAFNLDLPNANTNPVGGVYIYNPTHLTIMIEPNLIVPAAEFTSQFTVYIQPYSWKSLPLNIDTGFNPRVYIGGVGLTGSGVPKDLYERITVLWSDKRWTHLFPAGGGEAPNGLLNNQKRSIARSGSFYKPASGSSISIYNIEPNSVFYINYVQLTTYMIVNVWRDFYANFYLSRGFSGDVAGNVVFCNCLSVANATVTLQTNTTSLQSPMIASSDSNNNTIGMFFGGTVTAGDVYYVSYTMIGWYEHY